MLISMTCGKDWDLKSGGKTNVDTPETTHISLCSGYGGIDLGLKRVLPNVRTVAYAEIEAFACENLLARMEGGQLDAAPIWSDLKSFPWQQFSRLVDIVSGGFPCQPFSSAGKRAGDEDERHLFPYILEGISRCRPAVVFLENVEGILSAKLAGDNWRDPAGTPVLLHVFRELERVGYKPTAGIFSAASVGSVHQRKRVFILASRNDMGLERYRRYVTEHDSQGRQRADGHAWPSRPGQPQHAWEPPRVVGNATVLDGTGQAGGQWQAQTGRTGAKRDNRQTQPALGGNADGVASRLDYAELCVTCDNRTDELRLLGNGVVPQVAALAFRTLLDELQRE